MPSNSSWTTSSGLLINFFMEHLQGPHAKPGLFIGQIAADEPVIDVYSDHGADNRGHNWDPPIAIREQALSARDQAEEARAKVTSGVNGIAAGAAQAQANCQNCAADQEWAHIVHQASVLRVAAGQDAPQQNHGAENFCD